VFSVTIPNDVLGQKTVTAFGMTGPETGQFSPSITIDIETEAVLTALRVSPTMILFEAPEDQLPLTVTGFFADGSALDITHSSLTTYSSNDPTIASVDSTGLVTAVGPATTGATDIIVQYGSQSVTIPVSMPLPITTASDSIPPGTIAMASPTPNANGWNNTNVLVTLAAIDNSGGSGVKDLTFTLSGAETGGSVVADNSAVVMIATEGSTTLTYFARDNAGNQEASKTLTVRINKTSPRGDLDCDGDVDQHDLTLLLAYRNKPVSQSACGTTFCGTTCDLTGDGWVTLLDARELMRLCTRPSCATQ
jgi:hypothetical protein